MAYYPVLLNLLGFDAVGSAAGWATSL